MRNHTGNKVLPYVLAMLSSTVQTQWRNWFPFKCAYAYTTQLYETHHLYFFIVHNAYLDLKNKLFICAIVFACEPTQFR